MKKRGFVKGIFLGIIGSALAVYLKWGIFQKTAPVSNVSLSSTYLCEKKTEAEEPVDLNEYIGWETKRDIDPDRIGAPSKELWEKYQADRMQNRKKDSSNSYVEKKNFRMNGHSYVYMKYVLQENGRICLKALNTKEKSLYIPGTIDGYRVERLDPDTGLKHNLVVHKGKRYEETDTCKARFCWMYGRDQKLKKIVVGEGITRITDFSRISADTVVLPESLKRVDSFYGAEIKNVIVKGTKTQFSSMAFGGSSLEKIDLPDTYQGKLEYACFGYSNLSEFHWPSGLKKENMDEQIFKNCEKLEKITFSDRAEKIYIPRNTFWGCLKLKQLVFPEHIKKVFYGECAYADNFRYGVQKLVFLGRETELDSDRDESGGTIFDYVPTGRNYITVSTIAAPKDSEAMRYARLAVKVGWLKRSRIWQIFTHEEDSGFSREAKVYYTPTPVMLIPVAVEYVE